MLGSNSTFRADAIVLSNATLSISVTNVVLDANQGVTLMTGGGGTNMLNGGGTNLYIPGVISGSGPLAVSGTVVLGGANTYNGDIRFLGGTTRATDGLALQDATVDLNGADSGTLVYDSTSVTEVTWGGVSGTRNITLSTSPYNAANLNIGNNNVNCAWSGHLNNAPSGITLTKIGAATLTLQGQHAYTGDTIIQSGTLKLDTAYSNVVSSFAIAGGATLDVTTLTNSTLGDTYGQGLKASGNGSSGTITMAPGHGLTMGGSGTSPLLFTAYNGLVAPLIVSGTGGSLFLAAGNPVTVTVANNGTPLPLGTYLLIAASGSATVAGAAPTSVTVNGDGTAPGTIGSLSITGSQLYLTVALNLAPVTGFGITNLGNGSLSLGYAGGAGSQFVLLQTNDVTAPLANWTRVQTNPTPGIVHD